LYAGWDVVFPSADPDPPTDSESRWCPTNRSPYRTASGTCVIRRVEERSDAGAVCPDTELLVRAIYAAADGDALIAPTVTAPWLSREGRWWFDQCPWTVVGWFGVADLDFVSEGEDQGYSRWTVPIDSACRNRWVNSAEDYSATSSRAMRDLSCSRKHATVFDLTGA